VDARALLDGPLDDYVARRKAAAKALKAEGDKEGAKAIEALAKPTLTTFAVLRAADDPDAVRRAVAATDELAAVQAGSGDRAALSTATAARRQAIEDLVDAGLGALGSGAGSGLAGRADEVRAAIDQLTRHPELMDPWLDGTLRELPDAGDAGFGALAGLASVFGDTGGSDAPAPRRPKGRSATGAPGGGARKAKTKAGSTRRAGATADGGEKDGDEGAEADEPAAPKVDHRLVARAEDALASAEDALAAANADVDAASAEQDRAEQALADARAAVAAARSAWEEAEARRADADTAVSEARAHLEQLRAST
jgi:hypothetical protein